MACVRSLEPFINPAVVRWPRRLFAPLEQIEDPTAPMKRLTYDSDIASGARPPTCPLLCSASRISRVDIEYIDCGLHK